MITSETPLAPLILWPLAISRYHNLCRRLWGFLIRLGILGKISSPRALDIGQRLKFYFTSTPPCGERHLLERYPCVSRCTLLSWLKSRSRLVKDWNWSITLKKRPEFELSIRVEKPLAKFSIILISLLWPNECELFRKGGHRVPIWTLFPVGSYQSFSQKVLWKIMK